MEDLKKQCEICLENPHKYCCPKCGAKTCSLPCVKLHKQRAQCDGVVDNTQYVARSDFKENETLVQRDYNFLTRLNRTIAVQKDDVRQKSKRILNNRPQGPNKRHHPQQQHQDFAPPTLTRRGVHCRQLPRGMQRSVLNKSMWDKKLETFVWTLEFILLDPETGEEVQRQTRQRVPESTHVKAMVPFKMMEWIKTNKGEANEVFCFLRLIDRPVSSPEVLYLDGEKMLAEVIKDQTVIEFPTIIVSSKREIKGYKEPSEESESETDSSESGSDSDSDSSDSDSDSDSGSEEDSGDDEPEEESSRPIKEPSTNPLIDEITITETTTPAETGLTEENVKSPAAQD